MRGQKFRHGRPATSITECDSPRFDRRALSVLILEQLQHSQEARPLQSTPTKVDIYSELGCSNSLVHCLHNMHNTAPTYAVSRHQPRLKLGQVTGILIWVYCSISHKSNTATVQRTGPRLPAHNS
jgi:hypothetical protein